VRYGIEYVLFCALLAACGDEIGTRDAATGDASARRDSSSARADSGLDSGAPPTENNPDGYPTEGTVFYENDYETDTLLGMWEAPQIELDYGDAFGWDGSGAFRAIPQPFPSDDGESPNEDNAGWGLGGDDPTPPDTCRRLFVSYMLYVSQDLIDDIAAPPEPPEMGRRFWQAGNKLLDLPQWNESGVGVDEENGFRYVIKFRRNNLDDSGRVQFSHLAGGAGHEYFDDGENTNPDWRELGDRWVWVMHVLDEPNTEIRTYLKLEGDDAVRRALVRDETFRGTDDYDWLQSHGRGFAFPTRSFWGYWDDIVNAEVSDSSFVAIDRVRASDFWIDPPF
jgi:hypothetical protein